ncbi:MAG: class IV adenylate cyclase [Halobacteriota archaeon]
MATREVELKLACDADDLEVRLDRAKFEYVGRYRQIDRYFDPPHRDLAVTDEALRMRTVEDLETGAVEHRLTYKGPRADGEGAKARLERTAVVDSATAVGEILRALDFDVAGEVRKVRERYERDDTVVALDSVEGLGSFVELERVVRVDEVASAREELASTADALGLGDADPVERTYLALVLGDES